MNIRKLLSKTLFAPLFVVLLIACNNEAETPVTPPNYEIVSSETFKVLETYENGWIKEAVQHNFYNQPIIEFSYYQNGYLKSYRLYKESFQGDQVVTSLYLEHERNEEDLPVSSKYYDIDGNLFASLLYENGQLESKEIYFGTTTTSFLYQLGTIQSIEKTDSETDENILITYNYTSNKRLLKISTSGNPTYEVESSISNNHLGMGFNTTDDIPRLNLMEDDNSFKTSVVNTSFASSLVKKSSISMEGLFFSPVEYYSLEEAFKSKFGYRVDANKIKNLMNSDFNRSVVEQYPFAEETFLIAQSTSMEKQYSLNADLGDVITKTNELKAQHEEDFELLYGGGYVSKYFTGKNLLFIATIRNLPSDLTLRSQIIDAAEIYADDLLTNRSNLTSKQQELLSHVFFQLKAHSNLLGINGRVIRNYNDYEEVIDLINSADAVVVHSVISRHF